MNYKSVVNNIISRLQSGFASEINISVVPLPDNEADFKLATVKPVVFVTFSNTTFEQSKGGGYIVQDSKVSFEIITRCKSLYGSGGGYDIMYLVKLSLTGYEAVNNSRLYLTKEEIVGTPHNGFGSWCINQVFTFNEQQVQDASEEQLAEAIIEIKNNINARV